MTTAREYLRVSQDRSGRQRSIDEQHDDNVKAAGQRGISLGTPYQDATSASRFALKARGGFDRLMTDLTSGGFGADELWLWESSRGSRTVGEWATLIDVCDRANVLIHVTTHGRTYNPSNHRDRKSLHDDAADSEYESGKASARIRRATAASAALGRPHGKVPYGYRRTYDPGTGKMTGQVPEPAEAEIVRRLFRELEQGNALAGIAKKLAKEGIRSRTGAVFSAQHLRSLALNGTYAAIRVHAPHVTKHPTVRSLPGPGVTMTEGTWTPLVSRTTYHAVVNMLTDPARVTRKPGGARHLLSGIAVCDACEGPLSATSRRSIGPAYQCSIGCIVVPHGPLEAVVTQVILDYVARPDVRRRIVAATEDSPALSVTRDALADARARLQQAYASAALPGGISVSALAAMEPRIQAGIAELETRVASMVTPHALLPFVSPGADAEGRWAVAAIPVRREVARLLLNPDWIGQVRITRRPPGSAPFVAVPVEDRIVWRTTPR